MAVAVGAAIGSVFRQVIADAFPFGRSHWPLATLAVNLVGSFALGLVVGWMRKRRSTPATTAPLEAFLAVGVLGGFTTFSALSVEVALLVDDGEAALVVAYLASTIAGGLGAARVGVLIGRRRR